MAEQKFADNFKQTIIIETKRKTGETVIRISNPKFTTDEPTVRGTIIGDITNKSNEPKITDEQRTVLEALHLLGYNYIACDANNKSYAFKECPEKGIRTRIWKAENEESKLPLSNVNYIMEGICSWKDEKPTSIEWLLGKKAENE